jgi:hypothetical protein
MTADDALVPDPIAAADESTVAPNGSASRRFTQVDLELEESPPRIC